MPRLYSFSTLSLKGPGQSPGVEELFPFEYIKAGYPGQFASNRIAFSPDHSVSVIVGRNIASTTIDGRVLAPRNIEGLEGYPNNFMDVTYGAGVGFLAVGISDAGPPAKGLMAFSSNGVDWVARTSPVTTNLIGCTFANGIFVICGSFGNIWTSPDTINWTKSDTGNTTSQIWSIAWNGTRWHTSGDLVLTSTSPTAASGTWTSGNSAASNCWKIAVTSSGRFIAAGNIGRVAVSDSAGTTWTNYTTPNTNTVHSGIAIGTVNSVEYAVIVGSNNSNQGSLIFSTAASNFATWTNINANDTGAENPLGGISWNGREFLASGGYNNVIVGTSMDTWTTSSTSWTARSKGLQINSVDYSPSLNLYAAVGRYSSSSTLGGIFISSNGYTWTRTQGNTGVKNEIRWLPDNYFYVVANSGFSFLRSADGSNWSVLPQVGGSGQNLNSIAYGDGYYVVTGAGGKIFYSSTPTVSASWLTATVEGTPGGSINSVVFNNTTKEWLAVGDGGLIRTSTNGGSGPANWTTVNSGNFDNLKSIDYAHSITNLSQARYVAVGTGGRFVSITSDKSSYTTSAFSGLPIMNEVRWDSIRSRFIAVGANQSVYESDSLGVEWKKIDSIDQIGLTGQDGEFTGLAISVNNNQYLMTGFNDLVTTRKIREEYQIGDFVQGGYYAGNIVVNNVAWALIVAPKSLGESSTNLSVQNNRADAWPAGCLTLNNGASASAALAGVSSAAASFCENLSIDGYMDWYLPSRDELEICYRAFKPTTDTNSTSVRNWDGFYFPEGDTEGPNSKMGLNANSRPNGLPYTNNWQVPGTFDVANFRISPAFGTSITIVEHITGSTWVVAGSSTKLARTIDNGASWTYTDIGVSYITSLAKHSNGSIIVVGQGGQAARSIDNGSSWTNISSNLAAAYGGGLNHNGIAFGAGVFVVLVSQSFSRNIYSTDGLTWSQSTTGPIEGFSLVWHVDRFYSISRNDLTMWTSTNGITWTDSGTVPTTNGSFYSNGTTLIYKPADTSDILYVNQGGSSWSSPVSLPVENIDFADIFYANNAWWVIGAPRTATQPVRLATSSTGLSPWTIVPDFAGIMGTASVNLGVKTYGAGTNGSVILVVAYETSTLTSKIVLGSESSRLPKQTAISLFQSGGSEAFSSSIYWSSSRYGTNQNNMGVGQSFNTGQQINTFKDTTYKVRAVRKAPLSALIVNSTPPRGFFYASGNNIQRSVDGCSTWTTWSTYPSNGRMNYLFCNKTNSQLWYGAAEGLGFADGNFLYVSNNAGQSWTTIDIGASARWDSGLAVGDVIMVAAQSRLCQISTDGGYSWVDGKNQYFGGGSFGQAPVLGYITETQMFVVGTSTGLWTSKNAVQWTNVLTTNLAAATAQSKFVKSGNRYVLLGSGTAYVYTSDYGTTWTTVASASSSSRGGAVIGNNIITVNYLGSNHTQGSRSSNGGQTFSDYTLPANLNWWFATDDGNYIVVSDLNGTGLWRTTNPDLGWTPVTVNLGYGGQLWSFK